MADNIQVTPGSGATVGADECTVNAVSAVKVPLGKIGFGDHGQWTYASATNPLPISAIPATAGGLSMTHLVSANSNNATVVKNSAGQVYGIEVFNVNAAARYLKLYDKATAPNPASDTPVKTILIPGSTSGAGVVTSFTNGLAFSNGIAFILVTGMADTDNNSVGANDVVVNLNYK